MTDDEIEQRAILFFSEHFEWKKPLVAWSLSAPTERERWRKLARAFDEDSWRKMSWEDRFPHLCRPPTPKRPPDPTLF